ncbi:MAG: hypothetical protein HRU20_00125 [Pseudomonadales bacterium]|nr:hypothetical protein [Pseudomonadales bacterium]
MSEIEIQLIDIIKFIFFTALPLYRFTALPLYRFTALPLYRFTASLESFYSLTAQ